MSQPLTVVVRTHDPGPDLATVVAGLDAQTLRTDAFGVVFVDAGSTDGSLARLSRLAGSRPNVTLLTEGDLRAAVAAAPSGHVLVIGSDTKLLPGALARLSAAVGQGDGSDGADVVVGRRRWGTHGAAGPLRPPAAGAVLHGPLDPALVDAWADAALLVRREVLLEALAADRDGGAGAGAADAERRVGSIALERAGSIALVTDYACLLTPATAGSRPGLRPRPAELRWSDGALRVEVTVAVTAELADRLAGATPDVALVLAGSGGVEHVLETTCTVAPGGSGRPTYAVSAVVDGLKGSDDLAYDGLDGLYRVRLRLGGPDGGVVVVTAADPRSALLHGRPVVLGDDKGLTIDVGARASSLVTSLAVDAGSVVESARGSLLRVRLPELHVEGTEPYAGVVSLGGLWVPAQVVVEDGPAGAGAVLECYVSGLEGRSTIGLRLGKGEVAPSGCDLVMSHLGRFSLEVTPEPAAEPAAGATSPTTDRPTAPTSQGRTPGPAPSSRPSSRRPVSRLRRLRRAVPAPLEPVARTVAGFGPARTLYRRLARR